MILIALVVVGAMAAGIAARRRTARTDDVVHRLLDFVLLVLLPLISFSFATRLEFDLPTVLGLLSGYAGLIAVGLLAWLIAARILRLGRLQQGAVVLGAVMSNTGYLGLPVAATVLGSGELPQAVAWDQLVTNPISVIIAPFIAAGFAGRHEDHSVLRQVVSVLRRAPALVALLVGLAVPHDWVPDALIDFATLCVYATLPLGFFAVGATVQRLRGENAHPRRSLIFTVVGLRLLVAPALVALLLLAVPDHPRAFMLQAAMPSGVNALVVAHAFGLDRGIVATAIARSTLIVLAVALIATAVI